MTHGNRGQEGALCREGWKGVAEGQGVSSSELFNLALITVPPGVFLDFCFVPNRTP